MSHTEAATFRNLLSQDHQRLDAMLENVLELVHVDVRPQLNERWAAYEDGILAHLDAEEMFLLPGLKAHDPACAARISEDHAKIRELLAEIGVGLDLHIVREDQVRELALFLRAHAKMEEVPLYTWADTNLPTGRLASLMRRLNAVWDRVASSRQRESSSATPPEVPRAIDLI